MSIKIENKTNLPNINKFLDEKQISSLTEFTKQIDIEFTIVRGAFHNSVTHLKTVFKNEMSIENRHQIMQKIADTIGWHFVLIDGTHAIIKQKIKNPNNTWVRWKKNNPSSHLKEASKKNWEIYHSYIGDLDNVGKWEDEKFNPRLWQKA